MTSEYDVCDCGHCRVNHEPKCRGVYADGIWETPNTVRRDCNCKEFILNETYKEPPSCPTCGRSLEND